MQLKTLELHHFRNIEAANLTPSEELTVICGDNGQGKTNLLEAIWLLTGGKSFRGAKDAELIKKESPFAIIDGCVFHHNMENDLRISIGAKNSERPGRQGKKNGVAVGSASNLVGNFSAVVFAPEHLSLVKGSPDGRRRFLDGALCQLYPEYLLLYRRYMRVVAQKNAFLKKYEVVQGTPQEKNNLLDVYDNELCKYGEELQKRRLAYLEIFTPFAAANYEDISSGREHLSIRYLPSFETGQFATRLEERRAREIAMGCCLVGIHREDFELQLDGEPAKIYASQGQQRSTVLSLKLAEAACVQEVTEKHPVMLLDDVLSELDEHRQQFLLNRMQGRQTFVTSCDAQSFCKTNGKIVLMKNGELTQG